MQEGYIMIASWMCQLQVPTKGHRIRISLNEHMFLVLKCQKFQKNRVFYDFIRLLASLLKVLPYKRNPLERTRELECIWSFPITPKKERKRTKGEMLRDNLAIMRFLLQFSLCVQQRPRLSNAKAATAAALFLFDGQPTICSPKMDPN